MVDVEIALERTPVEYGDRMTAAIRSVLIEIAQVLGSFEGRYAVVGGAVPWLLANNPDMPHIGTIDIDLSLKPEELGAYEYTGLIEALLEAGYRQDKDLKVFQLVRTISGNIAGEPAIDVEIDFMVPRGANLMKNVPPILENFAVLKADGADLANEFQELTTIEGPMPDGGKNRVQIAVASIPALLAMKGFALKGRLKKKDAYDVYYCIRNYKEGPEGLAKACAPLLEKTAGIAGYNIIAEKFSTEDSFGPTSVRQFVEEEGILGERSPEEWQLDAFGQVDFWLRNLGLR
jgi:hypothetical protein